MFKVGQKITSRVTQRPFRVLETATSDRNGAQLVRIDTKSWEADWWPASRFYGREDHKIAVKLQIKALVDSL